MSLRLRIVSSIALWGLLGGVFAVAQEWSEAELIAHFRSLSPQVRELRARVTVTQADARSRTRYPNPYLYYSREQAGFTEFLQAGQTLPINGRIHHLRNAAKAEVSAAEAERDAFLWSLESDFRLSISRLIASQERVRLLLDASREVEQLMRLLRHRETEGEGSRYDRLRAERELMELHPDLAVTRSSLVAASAQIEGFLPDGTVVQRVNGRLTVNNEVPEFDDLLRRAFNVRGEYRALREIMARYQSEEQAARSLRIPEPVVTAGLKRAAVTSGLSANPFSEITVAGLVFGITVPLPLFNRGQYDVARSQAEQGSLTAQKAALERQIRTEVQRAFQVLTLRKNALNAYEENLRATGSELTHITQVAYQEGEIGILELLDALRVSRSSELRLLTLQEAVNEAWIELDRVVGEEVRP